MYEKFLIYIRVLYFLINILVLSNVLKVGYVIWFENVNKVMFRSVYIIV